MPNSVKYGMNMEMYSMEDEGSGHFHVLIKSGTITVMSIAKWKWKCPGGVNTDVHSTFSTTGVVSKAT